VYSWLLLNKSITLIVNSVKFCLQYFDAWLGDTKGIRPVKTLHQSPLAMVVDITGWGAGCSILWQPHLPVDMPGNVNIMITANSELLQTLAQIMVDSIAPHTD